MAVQNFLLPFLPLVDEFDDEFNSKCIVDDEDLPISGCFGYIVQV